MTNQPISKDGVIFKNPSDNEMAVIFEDGTIIPFDKTYWFSTEQAVFGMQVTVLFNPDMSVLGYKKAERPLLRSHTSKTAKAKPQENVRSQKKEDEYTEKTVLLRSLKDREEIQEILSNNSYFKLYLRTLFKKSVCWQGRSPRVEFFTFTIINALILILFPFLFMVLGIDSVLFLIGFLFLFIPWMLCAALANISLHIRRLHDLGKSGWWFWLIMMLYSLTGSITDVLLSKASGISAFIIVSLIGFAPFLWAALPSQKGKNKYGVNPLE